MEKKYIKLSIIVIVFTIILITVFSFAIPYYKNEIIVKREGTLLRDSKTYYNVKLAVVDYFNLLSDSKSYLEINNILLNADELTYDEFKEIVSSYQGYSIDVDKIYNLGDNTYRCEYIVKQDGEMSEGYLDYENLIDENEYDNIVVIKFNKEFDKYKVLYNKLELKGGNVYEE